MAQLCDLLPSLNDMLAGVNESIVWAGAATAVVAVILLLVSSWFETELSYIEKRSSKHKRRRRRRKHQIPWDKIKIIGKPTTCGAPYVAPKKQQPVASSEQDTQISPPEAAAGRVQPVGGSVQQTSVGRMKNQPAGHVDADAKRPADASKLKAS
jgi:hypothetical protein